MTNVVVCLPGATTAGKRLMAGVLCGAAGCDVSVGCRCARPGAGFVGAAAFGKGGEQ